MQHVLPVYIPALASMPLEIVVVTTTTQTTYVESAVNSTAAPRPKIREGVAEGSISASELGPVASGLHQLGEEDAEAMKLMLELSLRIGAGVAMTALRHGLLAHEPCITFTDNLGIDK